jgi:hypothetical protein
MAERIKKHWEITLFSVLGLVFAITGLIGILGITPNVASGAVSTTVVVTATVQEWINFTASATNTSMTPPLVNTAGVTAIGSSSVITLTSGTNAGGGFSVTVLSATGKLTYGATSSIASGSPTTTIVAGTDGYGIQASSTMLTLGTNYWNSYWAGNIVGAASTTAQTLCSTTTPAANAYTDVKFKAAAVATKAAGTYTDTLTFTMTGSY